MAADRMALTALGVVAICLTAGSDSRAAPVDYVQSIKWSKFDGTFGVQPGDAFGQSLVGVMQNESRYELNWVATNYEVGDHAPNYVGVPYYWAFTNNTSGGTGDIRPLASFAFGTAAMLATKTFSPATAGMSEAEALNQTELAIRGVAFAHVSNTTDSRHFGGGGYGAASASNQSAYWSAQAAEAAWMLWDKLSPETRTAVANMVQYEANSFINYTVPYWKNPNGSTNYSGDTKAEETAWNAQMPALAQAMMPSHPNVDAWRTKASEMQVSVLSRPSDNFNPQLVDGKSVVDWLHGYNAYANGALVNHGIVHPDYMAASVYLLSTSAVNESLAGQSIPQSTMFNVGNVYRALTEVQFMPGPDKSIAQGGYGTGKTILDPGGTIFVQNADGPYSPTIYYPEGNDWNVYVVTDSYVNTDLIAEWLGLDTGKSFDAMGWAQARVESMIALQNRPGHDGNIYVPSDWGGDDHGADEDFYRSNATAWLQWWLMQHGQMSPIADHWGTLTIPEPGSFNLCVPIIALAAGVTAARCRRCEFGNRCRPAFLSARRAGRPLVCAVCWVSQVAWGADSADYVQPIQWTKYEGMFGVEPGDEFGERLVELLRNESRYELRWVKSQYSIATSASSFLETPYYDAYTHFGELGYEGSIRALASFAYGTAVLLATDVYSSTVTGEVTSAEALKQTELAIRGVAFAHRANKATKPQFGGRGTTKETWQAAHWATQAARAAWLIWDRLAPETRTAVANMMIDEADSFIEYKVPYWKNSDGTTNFPGDTKAEENAWNAQLPALAQAMMPRHPNVEAWRRKASELQIAAYARPSDLTSSALVDGKPVRDWLQGFNTFEDGVLVNHGRVHPDYMLCISTRTSAVIYDSLAGQYIPQSAVFNAGNLYRAVTEIKFVPGADSAYETGKPILAPGGTIYQRTATGGYAAKIYYPQGNDWTNEVTDSYLNFDLMIEWLGLDAGKDFDAMGWARARVEAFIELQNRPGHDGNVYQSGDWFKGGRGADEDLYRSNAAAWLQWWLMRHGQMSPVADRWGPVAESEPRPATENKRPVSSAFKTE